MKPSDFHIALVAAASLAVGPLCAQTNIFPANGNVGIGTTSPATILHLSGSTPSILVQDTAGSGRTYSLSSRWGGYFTIFDESAPAQARFSITSAGDVGIGTTAPLGKLNIEGDTQASWDAGQLMISGASNRNKRLSIGFDTTNNYGFIQPLIAGDNYYPLILQPQNGNVGIGTPAPNQKLSVQGNLSLGTIGSYILMGQNAYTGGGGFLMLRSSGSYGKDFNIDNYSHAAGWKTNLFIAGESGNVGIGTVSPSSSLHVAYQSDAVGDSADTPVGTFSAIRPSYGVTQYWSGHLKLVARGSNETTESARITWDAGERLSFSTGSGGQKRLLIDAAGNVGIGTSNPTQKLSVNGTIRAKEVIVETVGWADYVFADDYNLKPLSEVEQHIKQHKHLPGIPSASEVAEKGVGIGEMQAKLLAKIEELTLHQIEHEKRLSAALQRIEAQDAEIVALKKGLN